MKKTPVLKKNPRAIEGSLKLRQTIDLAITDLNEDGFGVATHENTKILIAGTFPGELVRAKITFIGQRDTFAEAGRILRRSPDRTAQPACAKGPLCDGCPLIQMSYPAQLIWKKQLVLNAVHRYRSLGKVSVLDVIASPKPLHYRNSAKLVVTGKYAAPLIGIYRRNSHDVMDIGDCPLHHPLINSIIQAVRAGIKKGKIPIYNPRSEMGLLRYLVVRVSESANRAMVVFVTNEEGYNEIHHLAKYLKEAVPEVAILVQNINATTGNAIFGQRDRFISKGQVLQAAVGETLFSISPRSFFQVNSGSAQIIYEKVKEWGELTGKEQVVDLYCGIGGISLFLAGGAKEVVGIEVAESAVADAEKNATLNGVKNCRFQAGDAAKLLNDIRTTGETVDLIVLNPPRKGCDEEVLKAASAIAPAKIIYVSCSPQTLTRDLYTLSELGYRTCEIQPVDMFPQTTHIENVALLVKDLKSTTSRQPVPRDKKTC